jgi:nitrous oxide reductase accessory protein NosL
MTKLFAFMAMIILLASCSSARKASSSSKQQLDSTASHNRDTVSLKKEDSTGL